MFDRNNLLHLFVHVYNNNVYILQVYEYHMEYIKGQSYVKLTAVHISTP